MSSYKDISIEEFRKLQIDIYNNAVEHGWWENRDLTKPSECLRSGLLIASEAFEAFECIREDDTEVRINGVGKLLGLYSEIADIVIRVLDLQKDNEIDENIYSIFLNLKKDLIPKNNNEFVFLITDIAIRPLNGCYYWGLIIGLCVEWARMLNFDLWNIVRRKHEYNKKRPYKHGKKF